MHHGMGVSANVRLNNRNSSMQPQNGLCNKIENYVSDLGQWWVLIFIPLSFLYLLLIHPPQCSQRQCFVILHIQLFILNLFKCLNFLLSFLNFFRSVWRIIILGQFLALVLCFMTMLNHHINYQYHINMPTGNN